jgi:hypothetical protein
VRPTSLLSLPERLVRSVAALLGGVIHESALILLPRFVRRSRLYEASAKNLLRLSIELVGGVEAPATATTEAGPAPTELAVRKGAGNVVELSSIAAFGFSPLWLLAAASDVAHGSRVYLASLVDELKAAGVLTPEAEFGSVDELLAAFEGGSGTAARLIDIPPVELAGLKASVDELRQHAAELLRRTSWRRSTGACAPRRASRAVRCSRSHRESGWRSCSPPGRCPVTMWSCPTERTGGRCATRASVPTRAACRGRTCTRSGATSTCRRRPGRSAASIGSGGPRRPSQRGRGFADACPGGCGAPDSGALPVRTAHHQSGSVIASPGPVLGAPTSTNSAPSGPASSDRVASFDSRTAVQGSRS